MQDYLQIRSILEHDTRYKMAAYYYVQDMMNFARTQLGMGHSEDCHELHFSEHETSDSDEHDLDEPEPMTIHISVKELCEAIRIHAAWRFGYLAKVVLNQWGIHTTDDIGEIVFNMVESGKIRLANGDSREDFHDLYDFQTVFCDEFRFQPM